MKIIVRNLILILLLISTFGALFSCDKKPPEQSMEASLWDSASYTESTTVGEGALSFKITVECEEKSITLTVKTDKETLGEALYELELINDPSFFDTANGIKADWNKDKAYWSFYIGDDYAMHGVDAEKITDGAVYKLVYTK